MTTRMATEITRRLEPVVRDPFLDHLPGASQVARPLPPAEPSAIRRRRSLRARRIRPVRA